MEELEKGENSGISIDHLTTGKPLALRACFDGKGCGQCGACCEFPFGFNVPTPEAIDLLRAQQIAHTGLPKRVYFTSHGPKVLIGTTLTIVPTALKTILGCPHHTRGSDGTSRCTVMDIRATYPELFINCNGFNGGAREGQVRNSRGKLRTTSNKHELCTFIVDVLFSPGMYSSFLLNVAHQHYLINGELDAIIPELTKALTERANYMGGGFFSAICDGYINAFEMSSDLPSLVKFIRDFGDFLKRNKLDEILYKHFEKHMIRSQMAIFLARIKLLLWGTAGDVMLQSFFPFKFKKRAQFMTDEHRGMVC